MTDTYAKNTAISAKDAEKLTPRAEFRVFGQGIIEPLKAKMWDAKATLYKVRRNAGGLRNFPTARQIPIPGEKGRTRHDSVSPDGRN